MPKNIVICSDGTGNTAIKGRGTNVFKLYEAVDLIDGSQVALYDDGVGTETLKPLKILGGAFGYGLSRNVRQLYADLARAYRPGDRIFLFGFSRGAFTVRTLAGLIVNCGVLDVEKFQSDPDLESGASRAYKLYRRKYQAWLDKMLLDKPFDPKEAEQFRRNFAVSQEVRIRFIGVWDTVAAVGLPFDAATAFWNNVIHRFTFPNQQLSPLVDTACHALAIDDERRTFHPLLWDEQGEAGGRIEQVWFAGVHSNVGGGYPKQGVSLVTLDWMMTKAEQAGLRFVAGVRQSVREVMNPHDFIYDSRSGLATYYRYGPRDIGAICRKNSAAPRIHPSVMARLVLGTQAYAPGNLPSPAGFLSAPDRVDEIRTAPADKTSLLDEVHTWVIVRTQAHTAFVGVSLLLLVDALRGEIAGKGIQQAVSDLFSMTGMLRLLATFVSSSGLLLIALTALFYWAGWAIERKMRTSFSKFWFRWRSQTVLAAAKNAGQ
jgi:hypothetical protein